MQILSKLKKCLLGLTFLAAAQAYAAPLELLESVSVPMSRYGQKWLSVYTKVRVQNLAFEKQIEVSFTDPQGLRTTAQASYVGPAADGYEIWESYTNLKLSESTGVETKNYLWRVNYRSAAGEFWNTEGDLQIPLGPFLYSGQQISLAMPTQKSGDNGFLVTAVVANLAYDKVLLVHYSCDGFASQNTQALQFQPSYTYGYGLIQSPTLAGFELWNTWLKAPCETVSYYLSYEVAGQKYQDGSSRFPYRSQKTF
jgi:hypothetical protein